MSNRRTHTNDEPKRKCPYCDWRGASRGLTLHVLNCADDAHGEKYETPDGFDATEADVVGTKSVTVDMPVEYDIGENVHFICDYCGKATKGFTGIKVHLNHTAGRGPHPPLAEIEPRLGSPEDEFPTFAVDDDGDIVAADREGVAAITDGEVIPGKGDAIQVLERLRDRLREMDDDEIDSDESITYVEEAISELKM